MPDFQNPTPSFYRLQDGNILAVSIRVHSIVANDDDSLQPLVNSTTDCYAFAKRWKPPTTQQVAVSPTVVQQNVKFEVLLEEFNPCHLSNGSTLNVKTVLGQVNKMNTCSPYGEPVYSVSTHPVFNVDEPKY